MSFIFDNANAIYFEKIKQLQHVLMQYLVEESDEFSVIYRIKHPYSDKPFYKPEYQNFMAAFEPYMINKNIGVKEWFGTQSSDIKNALWTYKLNYNSRSVLMSSSNLLYNYDTNLPEDITFYRKGVAWYITILHEQTAWLNSPKKEDLVFFKKHGLLMI
jgi:hypothetical protein